MSRALLLLLLLASVFADVQDDILTTLQDLRYIGWQVQNAAEWTAAKSTSINDYMYLVQTQADQFHANAIFLLQVAAFALCFSSGSLSWYLILRAKNSKTFW